MAEIFISIGSNINRHRHIRQAVKELRSHFQQLVFSPVYETPAVGFDGPPFFNLVAGFIGGELSEVKSLLRSVESQANRVRSAEKFVSRTLDLDILLYNDDDLHDKGIDIPRSEILKYAFVLKPLADVAAQRFYPGTKQTFTQLWNDFEKAHAAECQEIRRVNFSL